MSVIVDHKLTFGVIGIGNAGSQVAALAKSQLGLDAVAINSAEQDASQVEGIEVIIIGDGNGTARNRDFAKEQFISTVEENMKRPGIKGVCDNQVVFIVASTGGGTGSGIGPSVYKILRSKYGEDTDFVFVGILPFDFEDNNMRINTIECINELITKVEDATYVLFSNALTGLSEHKGVAKVNKEIIDFMYILMGKTEVQTELTAIDDQELITLIRTPGRMVTFNITREISKFDLPVSGQKEYLTSILTKAFKTSHQLFTFSDSDAELEENTADKIGIITHLESDVQDNLDYNFLMETFNKPLSMFQHTSIKTTTDFDANISIIATGLGYPMESVGNIQKLIKLQLDREASRKNRNQPLPLGVNIKSAKELKSNGKSNKSTDENVVDILKGFI